MQPPETPQKPLKPQKAAKPKPAAKAKRKVPKYDEALPEKVIELGKKGYCFEQITFELNYRQDAFRQYAKEHPEFKAALSEADKTARQMLAERRAKPNPVGRPTLYKPEFCEQVILMGQGVKDEDPDSFSFGQYLNGGASTAQMAREIGVAKDSLYEWAKVHPEFSAAFTRAGHMAEAWWEDKARNGIDAQGFNGGLWKVVMSARFPDTYRDTTRTELTGKDGKDLPSPSNQVAVVTEAAVRAVMEKFDKDF